MRKSKLITEVIVYTASRLESIANNFVFVPMGTTAARVKILGLLKKNGPMTSRRIMELSGGTKSNVSQRLDILEKNNLILRNRATEPEDKRMVIINLTDQGRKHLETIQKRMQKSKMCLASFFSEKEIENHLHFFEKINKILDNEENNLKKVFNKQ